MEVSSLATSRDSLIPVSTLVHFLINTSVSEQCADCQILIGGELSFGQQNAIHLIVITRDTHNGNARPARTVRVVHECLSRTIKFR